MKISLGVQHEHTKVMIHEWTHSKTSQSVHTGETN